MCEVQGAAYAEECAWRAFMQPVTAIVHIAGAQKLAVLCDGGLLLLDYESLEEAPLPGIKVICGVLPIASRPAACCSHV